MTDHSIIIEYKNTAPVELVEFTKSLSAIGDQFKRFVAEEGGIDPETRLFVKEIRPGSIIAELVELGKAANDLWEARDYIAPFLPMIQEATESILHLTPKAKQLDRATIRNVANIYAPITAQSGAAVNIIDNRGGNTNIVLQVTPPQASAIAYNAQHLLNSQFPDEHHFSNEPMVLFQLRDAPPGKTGDFGIIDHFSQKPKKLTFASDAVKEAILHENGHPFEAIFWVNGVVKTAGGSVAAYLIHELVDVTPRDVS